jgi:GNAT superfamily N-acetyltransferase
MPAAHGHCLALPASASCSAAYADLMADIRRAGPDDVAVLAAIAIAAYRHYIRRIGRPPAPMTADYDTVVRAGHAWVAVENNRVIGFVVVAPQPDHLLLENVAVSPAAQGRGDGARLLAVAEEEARRLGLSEIRLFANEAMTENLAYYPRHGYIETHRAEQDGFRRVYFSKYLHDRPSA